MKPLLVTVPAWLSSLSPGSGSGMPGSVDIVVDGQDRVIAQSIAQTIQELINANALLQQIAFGAPNAPPTANPPVLAGAYAGAGSGISRIQSYQFATLQAATGMNDGDAALMGGDYGSDPTASGIYFWDALRPQSTANNVTIIAGSTVTNGCWMWSGYYLLDVGYGVPQLDSEGFLTLPTGGVHVLPQFSPLTTGLTFGTGWATVAANPVGYWKDRAGLVHLTGAVSASVLSTTVNAFVLPAGFIPATDKYFVTFQNGAPGILVVGGHTSGAGLTAGQVQTASFTTSAVFNVDGVGYLPSY